MLTSFQRYLLVYINMVGTGRNKFLLQFHYMPSLDRAWEQTPVSSKKNTRILRFTSNPQIRVAFIMRKCLKIPFPLSMIAHKRSKIPQLNISWKKDMIWMAVQRTSHLMQIQLTQQILVFKITSQKCFQEFRWGCYFIWSPFFQTLNLNQINCSNKKTR